MCGVLVLLFIKNLEIFFCTTNLLTHLAVNASTIMRTVSYFSLVRIGFYIQYCHIQCMCNVSTEYDTLSAKHAGRQVKKRICICRAFLFNVFASKACLTGMGTIMGPCTAHSFPEQIWKMEKPFFNQVHESRCQFRVK